VKIKFEYDSSLILRILNCQTETYAKSTIFIFGCF